MMLTIWQESQAGLATRLGGIILKKTFPFEPFRELFLLSESSGCRRQGVEDVLDILLARLFDCFGLRMSSPRPPGL